MSHPTARRTLAASLLLGLGGAAVAAMVGGDPVVPTTIEDFHASGTQIGDVPLGAILPPTNASPATAASIPRPIPSPPGREA